MKRPRFLPIARALLILAPLSGCGDSPVDVSEPDYRGTVSAVSMVQDGADVLLTNVVPGENNPVIIVLVRSTTRIYLSGKDDTVKGGTLSNIMIGSTMSVRHDGFQVRTLPPQYYAVWVAVDSSSM